MDTEKCVVTRCSYKLVYYEYFGQRGPEIRLKWAPNNRLKECIETTHCHYQCDEFKNSYSIYMWLKGAEVSVVV